jgi:response regulator RpfG family c-di-GMP phosphodiesterase
MKNKTILLVDDYEPTNILHEEFIKIHFNDATIYSFTDAYKALTALKNPDESERISPDIIFLDINMPAMSGWEFLEAFKTVKIVNKENINIYMLSTFDDDKYRKRALKDDFVKNYFTKPLTKEILQQSLYDSITGSA